MDPDSRPLAPVPMIALVALVICDIQSGEDYREALLAALMRVAWPTRCALDQ